MLGGRWAAAIVSLLAAAAVGLSLLFAGRSRALAIEPASVSVAGTVQTVAEVQDFAPLVADAVVTVETVSCGVRQQATGFAVDQGIVTVGHVAESVSSVLVGSVNRVQPTVVSVSASSVRVDTALLSGSTSADKIPWATFRLQADEPVTVVVRNEGISEGIAEGFPASVQLRASGATWGYEGDIVVLDREVTPGFSGSPVLNQRGEVAAMVVAVDEAAGVTLAVPSDEILEWLESAEADPESHLAQPCRTP